MLLGLNYSSLFTEAIKWEVIGGTPHFSSPELTSRKSPLSKTIIITGSLGIDPRLFPKKGGGPTFKVNRRTLEYYLHFYSNFIKEDYQQFKHKMFNLLTHVHDNSQNFNVMMNKREI